MEIQFYPKSYGPIPANDSSRDARYDVMEVASAELLQIVRKMSRPDLIDWLIWNDPNGIYSDEDSLEELGHTMDLQEGRIIMYRQIMRKNLDWDGYMDGEYVLE